MQTTHCSRVIAAFGLALGCATSAHALSISTSGNLNLNTDIAGTEFALATDAPGLRIWTDSYQGGLNFDPTITLWKRSGGDANFVAQNDDDDTIGSGQTAFDAGLYFAALGAGDYLVTVTASPYIPTGMQLSQGFEFDPAYGPIAQMAISQWNQPSYDINSNNQKGTFWTLNVTAVPEPGTYALLVMGLGVMGWMARRIR